MRNIVVLWKNNLNMMVFKNIFKFLGTIMIPALIIFVFTQIFYTDGMSNINIGVINKNGDISSEYILEEIKSTNKFKIREFESEEEIKRAFSTNDILSALIIEEDFLETTDNEDTIKIISREGDGSSEVIEGILVPSIKNLEDILLATKGNNKAFVSSVEGLMDKELKFEAMTVESKATGFEESSVAMGFLIQMMLFKGLFGAIKIEDDKKEGVYSRALAMGVSTFEYYTANMLASVTALLIQGVGSLLAIEAFANIEFSVPLVDGIIIITLVACISVAIGTFCTIITTSKGVADMLGTTVAIISVMISGLFIPLEVFPDAINKISKITPTRWIGNILNDVQLGGSLLDNGIYIILIVLFVGVLVLAIAFIAKYRNRTYRGI